MIVRECAVSEVAREIVRRYVNLCLAHNYEPAQTLVLEQWIADALMTAASPLTPR